MNAMQRLVLASTLQELDYPVLSKDSMTCSKDLLHGYAGIACRKAFREGKHYLISKLYAWQLLQEVAA